MPRNSRTDTNSGDSPYERIGSKSSGETMCYSSISDGVVTSALDKVTERGDALVFGRTADGGAASIRVLSDKQVYKWYPADMAELQDLLRKLAE